MGAVKLKNCSAGLQKLWREVQEKKVNITVEVSTNPLQKLIKFGSFFSPTRRLTIEALKTV